MAWGGQANSFDAGKGSEPSKACLNELLRSLRNRMGMNGWGLTRQLREGIKAGRLERIKSLPATEVGGAEAWALLDKEHHAIAHLVRYPAVEEERDPDDVAALKNVLGSMSGVKELTGIPRLYARSHTPSGLGKKETAEVMVLLEPVPMTLRQYLAKYDVPLRLRMRAVFQILMCIQELHATSMPHESDITLDTVLVTGDLDDRAGSKPGRAVLAPSLFHTAKSIVGLASLLVPPRHARRAGDLLKLDIQACGALLEEVLDLPLLQDESWDHRFLRTFARSMHGGTFDEVAAEGWTARRRAVKRFTDIFGSVALSELSRMEHHRSAV